MILPEANDNIIYALLIQNFITNFENIRLCQKKVVFTHDSLKMKIMSEKAFCLAHVINLKELSLTY